MLATIGKSFVVAICVLMIFCNFVLYFTGDDNANSNIHKISHQIWIAIAIYVISNISRVGSKYDKDNKYS